MFSGVCSRRMVVSKVSASADVAKSTSVETVSEHVVDPADLGRFRRHRQTAVEQTLVKAVAGPKQQLVLAGLHRPAVAINRGVMDGVDGHVASGNLPSTASYFSSFGSASLERTMVMVLDVTVNGDDTGRRP